MDPTEFARRLDVSAQANRPSDAIIQGAVNYHWTFPIGQGPSVITSDADPPRRISDRSEIIAIDDSLGRYDSSTREITIFNKGIEQAASILNASSWDLALIVRLHEWAHALLHLGLEGSYHAEILRDESRWTEQVARMNAWFNSLSPKFHEILAQLLTREGLRWLKDEATIPDAQLEIDRIADVFVRLMRRQQPEYHIHAYDDVQRNRIINSIRLLKGGGLVGFDAWETTVKW